MNETVVLETPVVVNEVTPADNGVVSQVISEVAVEQPVQVKSQIVIDFTPPNLVAPVTEVVQGDGTVVPQLPKVRVPKPEKVARVKSEPKERTTIMLTESVMQRTKNISFYTPGLTFAQICEDALIPHITMLENARIARGEGTFPQATGELKRGRRARVMLPPVATAPVSPEVNAEVGVAPEVL